MQHASKYFKIKQTHREQIFYQWGDGRKENKAGAGA